MTLTFSELQQAASGLTDADMLLQLLSRPAFWALALLSLVLLIGSRFLKVASKHQNILAGVVLAFTVVGATLALPVSQPWVAAHGELAKKSAEFLGWKRTEAATFNRFEVLRLKRALTHDAGVGQTVLEGLLKKGSTVQEAEPSVMMALAFLHQASAKAEGPRNPAKLAAPASADPVIPPATK